MTEGTGAEERRSKRTKVMLAATIEHKSHEIPVRIVDMSKHGALVSGTQLPPVDSEITLRCGSQSVAGWVAWISDERAGVNFGVTLPKPFAPSVPNTTHLLIEDGRKSDFRRPGFRGTQMSPQERLFVERLMTDNRHLLAA